MKKKDTKFTIGVILIAIVVIIIAAVLIKNKKGFKYGEANNSAIENSSEEYVQYTDDGTKVNISKQLSAEKDFNGFKFSNIQLSARDGQTYFVATVTNTTDKDSADPIEVDLIFYTDKGEEVSTMYAIIGPVKSKESVTLTAQHMFDFTNAYDVKIISHKTATKSEANTVENQTNE